MENLLQIMLIFNRFNIERDKSIGFRNKANCELQFLVDIFSNEIRKFFIVRGLFVFSLFYVIFFFLPNSIHVFTQTLRATRLINIYHISLWWLKCVAHLVLLLPKRIQFLQNTRKLLPLSFYFFFFVFCSFSAANKKQLSCFIFLIINCAHISCMTCRH